MKKPKVSFVIPLHNEEEILAYEISKIVASLRNKKIDYEVLLVENNSQDGTYRICEQLAIKNKKIKAIKLNKADYGMALREGMLQAKGRIIVNYDIDFYDINFAQQAVALYQFGYDIIVASKNIRLSKDKRQFLRRLISSVYKYVLYYGFGLKVSDTHGIKAWRNDKHLKKLIGQTINNGEIFDSELIIRSQNYGRKLLELPTEVYEKRKSVTYILPRAIRGVIQILILWININLKKT